MRWGGLRHSRSVRRLDLADVADKAKSLAGDGPDQALFPAAVADRLAHRIDMTGQRRLGDDTAAPYRAQHIVLADDVLPVPHQIDQEVEHLRSRCNGF